MRADPGASPLQGVGKHLATKYTDETLTWALSANLDGTPAVVELLEGGRRWRGVIERREEMIWLGGDAAAVRPARRIRRWWPSRGADSPPRSKKLRILEETDRCRKPGEIGTTASPSTCEPATAAPAAQELRAARRCVSRGRRRPRMARASRLPLPTRALPDFQRCGTERSCRCPDRDRGYRREKVDNPIRRRSSS